MKYDVDLSLTANLIDLLGCVKRSNVYDVVEALINERNALRESHSMISASLHIASTKPSDIMKAIADVKSLLARPDATQPQLSEIRYVLHGDIQPCSVLYSDETTTLLRLDEGDVMCETDTIEWSDSVTYRCQELLKSVDVRSLGHVAPRLAQLVRDERILLNDNGEDVVKPEPLYDDELSLNAETLWCCTECHHKFHVSLALCPQCHTPKTAHIKVDNFSSESLAPGSIEQPCDECSHIFDAQSMTCPMCNTIRSYENPTAVVPAPPPFPRGTADHNNPYVHTTTMFSEEAMRSHGWTNEALVSCGHGHYAPMQYPADTER